MARFMKGVVVSGGLVPAIRCKGLVQHQDSVTAKVIELAYFYERSSSTGFRSRVAENAFIV